MSTKRLSTGIPALDEILYGGLIRGRAYMIRGGPGSGKTTLGLHFLTAGVQNGERVLFITFGERESQIRENAHAMGFDLSGVDFLELCPSAESFAQDQVYDIFSPAEVEREPITSRIVECISTVRPRRVFMDAITQFRYLAPDPFQFRRQMLSFLQFLIEHEATVLFTSESSETMPDEDLQFVADGVINLIFNGGERVLSVTKFRGSGFLPGCHSLRLGRGGMRVFPRLLPEVFRHEIAGEVISSGVAALDELLHGGLERGTIAIITGPSGTGKSTLGFQFIKEAAERGEPSTVYLFEEEVDLVVHRCEALGIPVRSMIECGTLSLTRVNPLEYTPDQFALMVRRDVEERDVRVVMIDSMAGYRLAFRAGLGPTISSHLHALSKYLANRGVLVILINEIERVTGEFHVTEMGTSYLADTILFLRFLEINGQLRKAVGVLKKRLSDFEKSLREIEFTDQGIRLGEPLVNLRGILSGIPELIYPRR